MFENQTDSVILDRALSKISDLLDKRQGSIIWDMLSPFSLEAAQHYIELDNVLNFGFADTSSGDYLERRCKEVDVTRKAAVPSTGTVTLTNLTATGQIIPAGLVVYATTEDEEIYFRTLSQVTIPAGESVNVQVEAEVGGISGNVPAGAITQVLGDLSGLITVTNNSPFTNGLDKESDADLLARYYNRMRNMSASGSIQDYTRWALEITNIGAVRVFPLWDGPGTVKLVLLTVNRRKPSTTLVNEVKAHIEESRPVCAEVTVVGATEVPIDITVSVVLAAGATLTQAQTQIDAAVTAYLSSLAFSDRVVRYTKIADCITHASAVLDYQNLKINSGTNNITVNEDEIAYLGSMVLTSTSGGSSGGSGGGEVGPGVPPVQSS